MSDKPLPVVYIAGPITIPDPVENTHEAVLIADGLYTSGVCVPVVPHLTLTWHLIKPHKPAFWYQYDTFLLRKCDGLLRLPGVSVGADLEIATANRWEIPVFFWEGWTEQQVFMDWCSSWQPAT